MFNFVKKTSGASGQIKKYYLLLCVLGIIIIFGFVEFRINRELFPWDKENDAYLDSGVKSNAAISDGYVDDATQMVLKNTKQVSGVVTQTISLEGTTKRVLTIHAFVVDEEQLKNDAVLNTVQDLAQDIPMKEKDVDVTVNEQTVLKGVSFKELQPGDFISVQTTEPISSSSQFFAETVELVKRFEQSDKNKENAL